MTDRIWKLDELERVHRLPDGWRWVQSGSHVDWIAAGPNRAFVRILATGQVLIDEGEGDDPEHVHRDVVLAVILASKGLDSYGDIPPE